MIAVAPLLALLTLSLVSVSLLTITSDVAAVSNKTFDYVIVGGGTAGLVIASRLAEVPGISILVIEAGTDEQNNTAVNNPELWTTLPNTGLDWRYNTTQQLIGRKVQTVNGGKLLGGSSSINGQEYARGTKDQYDELEKLGNPGWNWNSMLKYMMKSEGFHLPNPDQIALGATADPDVHGLHGPLSVSYPQPYAGARAFQDYLKSAQSVIPGVVPSRDVSDGDSNGGSSLYFTIIPGNSSVPGGNRRSSAAVAYVYPSLGGGKQGLTILTGHQATSIKWNSRRENGLAKASGVEFAVTPDVGATIGTFFSVRVSKDVVVTSGALGSPHFLELSGIGDKKILEKASIDTVVDLPSVGTNYQDGASAVQLWNLSPDVDLSIVQTTNCPGTGASVLANITQILGEVGGRVAAQNLISTVSARAAAIVASGAFTSQTGLERVLAYQAESIAARNAPVIEMTYFPDADGGFMGVVQFGLIPQARGTIHVASNNPSARAVVDPQFLHEQVDRDILGNSTKLTRAVFATQPVRQLWSEEFVPGLAALPENATNSDWQAFIENNYNPVLKPIGTVSMLPREMGGAVDSRLVVYGTSNVRVADASILPIQISAAHMSATVYGIAEKAADIIKLSM